MIINDMKFAQRFAVGIECLRDLAGQRFDAALVHLRDLTERHIAEYRAIAKDQVWGGKGYTKYTFEDNSVLIFSGPEMYALDADSLESINGYAAWLGDDAQLESAEIERLRDLVAQAKQETLP